MQLNQLLAAPGFGAWLEGEPLDIDRLLYSENGRPRVSVISIAHLDDQERMFFVSLLLNEIVGWMRSQRGTSSLRALIYFDEIFGFLPPVANPPSKAPLLTILKQARAFGLGLVVATQNPVDLDYKALANAGTWMLGRLQTERDKARVLDGLEGAAAGPGARFDRARRWIDLLSALGKRQFLLHNVHEQGAGRLRNAVDAVLPARTAGTRRDQDDSRRFQRFQRVPEVPKGLVPEAPAVPARGSAGTSGAARAGARSRHSAVVCPRRDCVRADAAWASRGSRIRMRSSVSTRPKTVAVVTPITDGAVAVDWERAELADFTVDYLLKAPPTGATFARRACACGQAEELRDLGEGFFAVARHNRSRSSCSRARARRCCRLRTNRSAISASACRARRAKRAMPRSRRCARSTRRR